jgi:Protein of unknown function (DUF4232)
VHTASRLTVLVALAAGVLSGCGSGGTPSSDGSSSTGASTSTSPSTSTATSATPGSPTTSASAPSASATSGPAGCTLADLRVSLGPGEGAAGSTYFPLRLTNVSPHPCRTGGFGGASLVGARGALLGAPADRVQKGKVRVLVLRPGGRAEATLQETNAENYSAAKCRPAPAKGFRVYPPNETRSAYLPHPTTACASSAVHLLTLTPYRKVG